MGQRILITGGAGFIGSHLADELLACGHHVRVLDPLIEQVHGSEEARPAYLHPDVELVHGDVRDATAVRRALAGVDAVYHFAARVGVGQSMYEIAEYTSVNNMGTAVLLEALMDQPVGRLVVASSMSIYGEGLYRTTTGQLVNGVERTVAQLRAHDWELHDNDGGLLEPVPTPESKTPALASVYALSKYDQERMCLVFGRAYNIPTVALRFFNAYGPRQALSNPYTGVLAIFASRLLNDQPPLVYEDGEQRRDFVSVYDVARACRLALDAPGAVDCTINIGSGQPVTVREIAMRTSAVLGKEYIVPTITGNYRAGDIRHCFADTTLAQRVLGYTAAVTLEEGLVDLAGWLEGQTAHDRAIEAGAELAARGLTL
jgi:dTDP-L-rhamnose 4-epimerase